ncbi:glycosyl transferase [Methyloceanibacter stevinii]|uniref:Glycosyl transferase n=1 Tax=Methyloceanibacter stevinii TaxID=1774970 RepID=A0A1E3VQS3_9HYPH|nr:glycosyltransferase family 2 protein [Methyloceanibacter stevinii]ODR95887.1 glycosyl transferase [Methyloceanibacter stevinii]
MPRKLVIQIPCLNEAETLPVTLKDLPREVDGFDVVEWLVIDDGSSDDTAKVAREHGANHVLQLEHNQGLARAFMAGLECALKLGADVIVNTDADNQYSAKYIPDLVRPIVAKEALIVVGTRPVSEIEHFSPAKKVLQKLGSWVVKIVSGTKVEDAPSGFRAIHRDAAIRLNVFNGYTYTLETIIQAGRKGIPIVSVPVDVNPYLRPSRLISSIPVYIQRSVLTMLRIFVIYKPLRFFMMLALVLAVPAIFFIGRFLIFYAMGNGQGHIQSLVIAVGLLAISFILAVGGILADLVATNRLLLEDIRMRTLRAEIDAASRSDPNWQAERPNG